MERDVEWLGREGRGREGRENEWNGIGKDGERMGSTVYGIGSTVYGNGSTVYGKGRIILYCR